MLPDTDLNNVILPAIYLIDYRTENIQNAPNVGEYFGGVFMVFKTGSRIAQILFSSPVPYIRTHYYGRWSNWYKIGESAL